MIPVPWKTQERKKQKKSDRFSVLMREIMNLFDNTWGSLSFKIVSFRLANLLKVIFQVMRKGGIPLMHASHHKFRKSDKKRNIDIKTFLVKHSETAAERAIREEKKFQERFIRQGYYEDDEPFKSTDWMREENRGKWLGSNFRYGFRTENERVN